MRRSPTSEPLPVAGRWNNEHWCICRSRPALVASVQYTPDLPNIKGHRMTACIIPNSSSSTRIPSALPIQSLAPVDFLLWHKAANSNSQSPHAHTQHPSSRPSLLHTYPSFGYRIRDFRELFARSFYLSPSIFYRRASVSVLYLACFLYRRRAYPTHVELGRSVLFPCAYS